MAEHLTTGLAGLDRVLRTLLPGDNIVWQIDSVDDYARFVEPCCKAAVAAGRQVVYFRFAKHAPLLPDADGIETLTLHPESGFEEFIRAIHHAIDGARERGVYIFDCLSDLVADWYSDRMLGNFFRLICPYVYDVEGLACFAMLRNYHSPNCQSLIAGTTQIFIDAFRYHDKLYIRPVKVQQRHSPTMYMLHAWEGDTFRPVTASSTTTDILKPIPLAGLPAGRSRLGVWDRAFWEAEQAQRKEGETDTAHLASVKRRLLRMLVSRDERMHALAEKYLDLNDVLGIWRRTIGTGLVGGKAVGMLMARGILARSDPRWQCVLEEHDSFFIGSDVFYSYLVQNGCWWLREKQKDPQAFLEGAEEARRRILTGTFPPEVHQDLADMLDYFGQCPIIVRSSSLLEDAFGNSFAGKYESIFCVNQGSRDKRLEDFLAALRTIYASTMSEKALRYRAERGLLGGDEQMAVLVQRVSGAFYGQLFYPQAAGVAFSFNPYVWSDKIDPEAGVLRLVFGLGTRAVDRHDDDYTRIVALNAPDVRPESGIDEVRRYAQRRVDVLDIAGNQLVSQDFVDVLADSDGLPIELLATRDRHAESRGDRSRDARSWVLTFEALLADMPFVRDMRAMLDTLQEAYGSAVDVEFTLNLLNKTNYRINLVQCRPFQVAQTPDDVTSLPDVEEANLVFRSHGAVVGPGRVSTVDRLIYVVPSTYSRLSMSDRYSVARLIGRLMHLDPESRPERVLLLGPGRWGTTTPSLGVPVSYAEIKKVAFLCEIVMMHEGLVPDVSLGTHFFNELVESDILYLAIFPERESNALNEGFLQTMPNCLGRLLPDAAHRADVVRVLDTADLPADTRLMLHASNRGQQAVCYLHASPGRQK